MNHLVANSFQNEPNVPPYIRDIVLLSCACHSLALAINDVLKTADEFAKSYNNLSLAVKFLSTKNLINFIEVNCPPLSPTRWTGIFDVAYWIINHNGTITSNQWHDFISKKALLMVPSF